MTPARYVLSVVESWQREEEAIGRRRSMKTVTIRGHVFAGDLVGGMTAYGHPSVDPPPVGAASQSSARVLGEGVSQVLEGSRHHVPAALKYGDVLDVLSKLIQDAQLPAGMETVPAAPPSCVAQIGVG